MKNDKIKTHIEGSGIIVEHDISKTLKENYMPYAMSVIISRALPEIDGFKPSHRKILYTMYKMGLLNSSRTKSANVVGQTMKLNPHGDMAIYETLVRLSKGYEVLLHPYIDSKGNFGKSYSRDMSFAASRYTEVKLMEICNELFLDIDKDTVDFVDNYDNTMKEPILLPCSFPSILTNSNIGIAVGMASSICSFNLKEVCETTINLIKDKNFDIKETLKAPDFSGGGFLIYDEDNINSIYDNGKGSIKIRAKYEFDASQNCIDITEIPPSTTIEAIIDKIIDVVKTGKIKDISDVRDETDLNGLKITVDLKRGASPLNVMTKLYKLTPLEDSFSCNFNLLINGVPQTLGVKDIIFNWIEFRQNCIIRRLNFELNKKNKRLNLLLGLQKILVDIDKAIKIIRDTEFESDVIPNLMIGFGLNELQAEYIADIKIRHLNREYILNRLNEIDNLNDDILNIEDKLKNSNKIDQVIIEELQSVIKKYNIDRKTYILYDFIQEDEILDKVDNYSVKLFLTNDGYFKKIVSNSFKPQNENKLKENDFLKKSIDANNIDELLFFTDDCTVYKSKVNDFEDMKTSSLGEFLPIKLSFSNNEKVIDFVSTSNFKENIILFFENGKVAKIPLSSYMTKTKRKKLINAYSNLSSLIFVDILKEDKDYLIKTSNNEILIINTQDIPLKSTKNTQGVIAIKLLKNDLVVQIIKEEDIDLDNKNLYTKKLGSRGVKSKDDYQISF